MEEYIGEYEDGDLNDIANELANIRRILYGIDSSLTAIAEKFINE